jgi:hypothetical protein
MAAERTLMNRETPPRWAEILLFLVLDSRDRASVSGDLLEEFRERILPARGLSAAGVWYIRQVMGFVLRSNMVPAVLFGGAFVIRTALDWLQPTVDFHTRSMISTLVAATILLLFGFMASWKSGMILAGGISGIATTALAASISIVGTLGLLAVWHDPNTLQAIEGSGGLAEVFSLPVMLIVPGMFLGTIGGVAGTALHRGLRRPH